MLLELPCPLLLPSVQQPLEVGLLQRLQVRVKLRRRGGTRGLAQWAGEPSLLAHAP